MTSEQEGRDPTPAEEAGRILELLADVEDGGARIGRAAFGAVVTGSNAAADGARRKGGLVGTFAVQQMLTALEHLLAWRQLAGAAISRHSPTCRSFGPPWKAR